MTDCGQAGAPPQPGPGFPMVKVQNDHGADSRRPRQIGGLDLECPETNGLNVQSKDGTDSTVSDVSASSWTFWRPSSSPSSLPSLPSENLLKCSCSLPLRRCAPRAPRRCQLLAVLS